jgi:hypothetical protein
MLTLTHATERDVDMLLIEELAASPDFATFVLQKALGDSIVQIAEHNVFHSVRRTHNRREIDIQLNATCSNGKRYIVLIENKLDTTAQMGQAQSYQDEANVLLALNRADLVKTMLVCPKHWPAADPTFADEFDAVLSYENIGDFLAKRNLQTNGEIGARLSHRIAMLEQALSKARRGYQPIPEPDIDDFNARYIATMKEHGFNLKPGPKMLKSGRPRDSRTMIFDRAVLPDWPFLPRLRLVHQLSEGAAKVNFFGWGNQFSKLATQISIDIEGTGWHIAPTKNSKLGGGTSLSLIAETTFINNLRPFEDQIDAVLEGLNAVNALKDWLWSNQAKVEAWSILAQTK